MRRNLIFDILLMSLFLIFGGSVVNGQDSMRKGKDEDDPGKIQNPIFGDIKGKGDGGGNDQVFCHKEDENGQFCFRQNVNFINLEFEKDLETGKEEAILPCDLNVGITLGGSSETKFIPLSTINYSYNEDTEDYNEHYEGFLRICYDANVIYDIINYSPTGECDDNPLAEEIIGSIRIFFDIYCNEPAGMVKVDYCNLAFKFLETYIYGGDEFDGCSFEHNQAITICCSSFEEDQEDGGESTVRFSIQNSEINVEGKNLNDGSYKIFSLNGVLLSAGRFENTKSKQHIIRDLNLENGIYILVLYSKEIQSSHKFALFR